jgi:ATP-dependent RNA helicase DDX3X
VDFISRPEILTLKRLKYMVIDEADEMLQSDWEEELNKIMSGGGRSKLSLQLAHANHKRRSGGGKHQVPVVFRHFPQGGP